MRVRIIQSPREKELDGLALDRFTPGTVLDVSATVALWLIAEGYAAPEMRRAEPDELGFSSPGRPPRTTANDRRRRSTDR